MGILKDFDIAISREANIPSGFKTETCIYDSYMSNAAWDAWLSSMSIEHQNQFGGGSGGELKEKDGRPPKMASFASSSRMTYLLSKDIPGFVFEKQLSTVIGGIANLDGYCESYGHYTFVEAKCREPYSHKSPQTIRHNYKPLYLYLQSELPELFACEIEDISETRDMRVAFFCRGKEVVYFDTKQMLCHLLGIANRLLSDSICDTPIHFLYLLYNPTGLALPEKSQKEILRIYQATCETAENYDFSQVFACVVDFLMEKKDYPTSKAAAEKLKQNFRFTLCDQFSYGYHFL